MAASRSTITLANGTSIIIACRVCGKPATQGLLLKLCQDCGTPRKTDRKHDLEDSETEDENEDFEEPMLVDATPNKSNTPEDVEIKRLDRPYDNSGFDGQGRSLAITCVQQKGRTLVFHSTVEDSDLDLLKMLPSAVNFPLNYCRTMHEAGALISTWLTKSLQEIEVFFTKKGVFLGPHFVAFKLPVIACRLEQVVEYGIDDKRWRVDRILDERVRGYRMAAKQFESKCKELRQKMKSWNVNNAGCQVYFKAAHDPVAKIEGLGAQILNAWRPTLEPKADVSTLFGGLSVSSSKTSNDKLKGVTVAKAREMQKSSVFAPAPKKAENKAKDDYKHKANNRNKMNEKKPTPQQIFYANAEPKQVAYSSTLQADPSANRPSPKSFEVDYGANEYVARQRAKDATEKVCDIGADESEEPASNDLYPLPALSQEQLEDMQEELGIGIVDGLQKANTHDALQIELYRREKQLEATPKIHVKKRNAISAMIEKLKQKIILA
ncbi:hypothetical protein PRZ48_002489 [Zasmidium cellare]|uniref:Uncharacterized protein n=1 Tax=Zasmidium cellare TaxID=395010 RepID=A0ABR0F664_ZASCE|nr:hypothetical protein PRZ48_002489 [Zasmidium cellare]